MGKATTFKIIISATVKIKTRNIHKLRERNDLQQQYENRDLYQFQQHSIIVVLLKLKLNWQ